MIFVRIVDENGWFLKDNFVDELTKYTITDPCPDGFYHPRRDFENNKWYEGGPIPPKEQPVPPTTEDRISALETLALQLGGVI